MKTRNREELWVLASDQFEDHEMVHHDYVKILIALAKDDKCSMFWAQDYAWHMEDFCGEDNCVETLN